MKKKINSLLYQLNGFMSTFDDELQLGQTNIYSQLQSNNQTLNGFLNKHHQNLVQGHFYKPKPLQIQSS